ncbi:MAG: aminotransferase class III-fold pyridoxal phosphate-dependent enzyme [Gammaproteobacteria bacterium]|nr:aminotransferase class III-fold pyridoxal phosphate-dependent enzyme [Gammaproteobacteria bacterium]
MSSQALNEVLPDAESAVNMDAFWMPFTANRDFKNAPRLIDSAKGFYYTSSDDRQILDTLAGLWTSGAGHCHPLIVEAVQKQVAKLDYAISFQVGHPGAFELADRVTSLAPEGFDHCFFTNSGSESVETALKIALGYHHAKGDASRTRLVGREKGYHGVNFGGISVGGLPANRKMFSNSLLPNTHHLPHTHNLEYNAFSHGSPNWGAHLADDLENIVALQDASNIAAVIVEPVAGSAGVLVPPVGYLKKLREICTRHGILLIFDEVITAFGRVGAPFASQRFEVVPDIITTAKGLTNGVIPMGAVLVKKEIHEAFMNGPEHAAEIFHGYTYSGHPVATAAGLASLDVYEKEGLFERARANERIFEDALHSFKDMPNVIDIRNFGLMGAIEFAPREGQPGIRGLDIHKACFEAGLLVRNGMDTIVFSPFLAADESYFQEAFEGLRKILTKID